ncbi:hypothetical protein CLIB1444_08S01244 [[Candida] jaroonii]|uniref:Uncharacterized protein n=1 Tax=[Candida] jaroonii TaxID=467808 RepID=A0ACA9YAH9_9ASCO|nr:hypothetical protein CLIB1444_08S01244 [[Candida] jaroonii]
MNITFNDAKIIQYKYAIHKIRSFIKFLNEVRDKQRNNSEKSAEPTPEIGDSEKPIGTKDKIVICHYLTLLSGVVFAINEGIFNPKLELLSQFKLFRISPINVSPIVSHIPYDINDNVVNPLIELPKSELTYKCVSLLITLYNHCLSGYEKRYQQAITQYKIKDETNQAIDDMINEFCKGLDISGSDEFIFEMSKENKSDDDEKTEGGIENEEVLQEANLIDIDIKMNFVVVKHYRKTLADLKKVVEKYKLIKSQPATKQTKYLSTIPHQEYSLHKLLILILRVNDIYFIIRKFARKVYISNYAHLNDQKLVGRNQYFKSLLKSIDELFNGTKKNGVMIATITRFIRVNSQFTSDVKNILDFNNFVNQGIMILENSISKLIEFGQLWSSIELKFRKLYGLPFKGLVDIIDEYSKEEFPQIEENYFEKRKEPTERIFNRPSRSSSVSSNSSNTSSTFSNKNLNVPSTTTTTTTTNNSNGVQRKSSINSLRTSPRQQRPNSMISMIFMNPPTAPNGRRRSNSQDDSYLSSRLSSLTTNDSSVNESNNVNVPSGGAAAAAAALKKKATSMQHSQSLPTPSTSSSQTVRKVQPIIEEEPVKKLSANQRLQLHIRQAAKSGSLMTQEKEVMTSVVFDPNSPSSVNIRKYQDKSPSPPKETTTKEPPQIEVNGKLPEPSSPSGKTAPLKRKTRDQVTKLNTKRNEDLSRDSDSLITETTSHSDQTNDETSVVKKVRFIGVPDYHPSEDAPASYSSKILKNFAVFKSPAFKKKDQLFKKEESLLFKNQQQIIDSSLSKPLGNFQQAKLKIKTRLS